MNEKDFFFDEMIAGEEMDNLIAPITEWDHSHDFNECEDGFYTYCRNCGYEPRFNERENDCDTPPRYSEDVEAAWILIEKLQSMKVEMDYPGEWRIYVELAGYEWRSARGKTFPLALCRAVLKAKMEEDDGKDN